VSSVTTTVTFPSEVFTIIVSPARATIIPLTLALSPLAPKAASEARKTNAIKVTTIVLRCINVLPFFQLFGPVEGRSAPDSSGSIGLFHFNIQ
jgi:hypothetical protein